MSGKKKVVVIFGGQSTEHEVSRISANSILNNLDKSKFDVKIIGITRDGKWLKYDGALEKMLSDDWEELGVDIGKKLEKSDIDVIFPVLHGVNGEDGTIQGMFELAEIPYVGCGVLSSALCMDKGFTKIIFDKENIPQGKYRAFSRTEISSNIDTVIKDIEEIFNYPCFIKPCNAGSSVGVSKAHDRVELVKSLKEAARFDRRVLIEEFINCREVECAILGNEQPQASCVGEIIPSNEFYDYNAKYIDNASRIAIPADLSEKTQQEIRNYAAKAFKALDCSGLARVDFFVEKNTGKVFMNEINTMPGFTSISMYPKLWEASGIKYTELIEKLIGLALERFEQNKKEFI